MKPYFMSSSARLKISCILYNLSTNYNKRIKNLKDNINIVTQGENFSENSLILKKMVEPEDTRIMYSHDKKQETTMIVW